MDQPTLKRSLRPQREMRARSTIRSGFLMLGLGNEAPDTCILSAEAVVQTNVHKLPLRFAPVQPSSPDPWLNSAGLNGGQRTALGGGELPIKGAVPVGCGVGRTQAFLHNLETRSSQGHSCGQFCLDDSSWGTETLFSLPCRSRRAH